MSRGRDPGSGRVDDRGLTRLGIGFVLLVGVSGATMALQGGASLTIAAAVILGSVGFGVVLLWYLRRTMRELEPSSRRRR
ncbi:hypothetical protein [Halopiger goleimassiliensis]|uniref:hypothetical protein n=1 Tax=Halopiger goleimassiliensis TaxID=1293048 RepID=UPI00067822A2|nr:hypothetical protein [Halopiger goleimassiliensis]